MNSLKIGLSNFVRKHGSTVLTVAASAGVITTSVMVAKATKAVVEDLNEKENEVQIEEERELTVKEKAIVVIPHYAPAIVIGAVTISCILGIDLLGKKQQASLASAYTLLSTQFKRYREQVIDIYGAECEEQIHKEIALDERKDVPDVYPVLGGENLYFDEYTAIRFKSTIEDIFMGVNKFNEYLDEMRSVDINVLYSMINHPGLPFEMMITQTDTWKHLDPVCIPCMDDDGCCYWSFYYDFPGDALYSPDTHRWLR